MSMDEPLSRDVEILVPVLIETMKFATQSLAQSTALAEVLIAKGLVTSQELDEKVHLQIPATKKLLDLLDEQLRRH